MSVELPGENMRMVRSQLEQMLQLHPPAMAWAFVGMYLGHFAVLERAIDQTLVRVVGMGQLPFIALNRNLDLMAKVNVLRTLCDMVYAVPRTRGTTREELDACREKTVAALKELIRPHVEERNMVAHNLFGFASPASGCGVSFRVVKASNKLEITSVFWSIEDFLQKIADFERLELELNRFGEDAEKYGFHKLSRAKSIAELLEL